MLRDYARFISNELSANFVSSAGFKVLNHAQFTLAHRRENLLNTINLICHCALAALISYKVVIQFRIGRNILMKYYIILIYEMNFGIDSLSVANLDCRRRKMRSSNSSTWHKMRILTTRLQTNSRINWILDLFTFTSIIFWLGYNWKFPM